MSDLLTPSQALATVLVQIADFKDLGEDEVLEIDSQSGSGIFLTLDEIRRACWQMEQELQMFRLHEAGRQGRQAVEQLAMDQFVELVVDPEGKVVRPDFSRGDRS